MLTTVIKNDTMNKTIITLILILFTFTTTQSQSKSQKPTVIYSYVYFELINNLGMPFENIYEHIDKYWKVTKHKKNAISLRLKGKSSELPFGQYYYPYIEIVLNKGVCTELYFYGNTFNVFDIKEKNGYNKLSVKRSHLFIPDLDSDAFAEIRRQKKYTYKEQNVIRGKDIKSDNVYYYVPYANLSKGTNSNQHVEIIVKRKLGLFDAKHLYTTSVFLTVDGKNKNLEKMKRKFNFNE